MAKSKKQKILRQINKNYAFRKFYLIFSIVLFALAIALTFTSFLLTLINSIQLHNDGLTTQEVWIRLSDEWWSFLKVTTTEIQPEQSIFLTLSWFGIALLVLFGIGAINLIVSIALIISARSPKKITSIVQKIERTKKEHEINALKKEFEKYKQELNAKIDDDKR